MCDDAESRSVQVVMEAKRRVTAPSGSMDHYGRERVGGQCLIGEILCTESCLLVGRRIESGSAGVRCQSLDDS